MNQVFRTKKTLTFKEADPAGIMFFGNIFGIAHDAFEEFIVAAGYSWEEWFKTQDYIIPIRHTEANFLAPFFPGQTYDLSATVSKMSQNSFTMRYELSKNSLSHAIVTMVHTVVDAKTKQKSALPPLMRTRLENYLSAE